MLMHEWRQYRERQIRKAVQEAREAGGPPDEGETSSALVADREGGGEAPAQAETVLKSEAERPKQILDRLTSGNDDLRERLEALHGRQGVLPLDVDKAEERPSRSRRAAESRERLVQRLLDPVLSLEEAAVLLDVCPTTVRRYTNRGILKCYRTPGNQRRFRLSEVMSFMERRQMGEED